MATEEPSASSDLEPVRNKGGRPPTLSGEQLETLRELALANPGLSVADTTTLFCKTAEISVSSTTVRRGLYAAGVKKVRLRKGKSSADASSPQDSPAPSSTSAASKILRYGYTGAHRDEGDAGRYPHGLTDAEWELVRDLFEGASTGRPPKYQRRLIMDGCCYVVRSGCPWRMLPKDLPPWQDVYAHFRSWSARGLFEAMHDRLRAMWREREHRAPEPTAAVLDAQSVKTSAQGGPKGFDAGKKVKGRKRHLVTDTLGLMLAIFVTVAGVQDRDAAEPAIALAKAKYPSLSKGYVDGAYAGKRLAEIRSKHGIDVEVVRHPGNRNVGRWSDGAQLPLFDLPTKAFVPLPKRWVIERTNAWNDRCRRLEKDQDRRLDVATAWVWLAEGRLLLHRIGVVAAA